MLKKETLIAVWQSVLETCISPLDCRWLRLSKWFR